MHRSKAWIQGPLRTALSRSFHQVGFYSNALTPTGMNMPYRVYANVCCRRRGITSKSNPGNNMHLR